jgi:DNA-binding LacI/PurR family transcriptional regulator
MFCCEVLMEVQTINVGRGKHRATYAQIAQSLRRQRDTINEVTKLSSEIELAEKHNVARMTVRRAMDLLEREGAVIRRQGHGTFLQPKDTNPPLAAGSAVGFVSPWWVTSINAWYAATVFDGVTKWADKRDCHINVLQMGRFGEDLNSLFDKVSARKLRGLVWVHPVPEQIEALIKISRQIPCVVVGREYQTEELYTVVPDYEQAVRLLDNNLVAYGHKNYAVLSRCLSDPYAKAWHDALKKVQKERNAHFDGHEYFLDITPFDRSRMAELIQSFYLPSHPEVSAIITTSSSYLTQLFSNQQFKDSVCEKLSLAAFDYGVQAMSTYIPGLDITHVTCDWPQIGARAMDMLFSILEGRPVPKLVKEPVQFVNGKTVKKIN